jgi:hypothetical protein
MIEPSIDQCPTCMAWVPGVDSAEVFEGAIFTCSGKRRHELAVVVSKDGKARLVDEDFEERAGILESDAGLSRDEAEKQARGM